MDNNSFNLKMIKIKIFEVNSFLNILRQNKIIINYEKETKELKQEIINEKIVITRSEFSKITFISKKIQIIG